MKIEVSICSMVAVSHEGDQQSIQDPAAQFSATSRLHFTQAGFLKELPS